MSKTVPWFWASALAVFTLCACTPDAVVENRPDAAPGSATSPALVAPSSVAGTTPAAVRHRARDCTARDLVAHLRREHEGAGGHLVSLLDFGNASATGSPALRLPAPRDAVRARSSRRLRDSRKLLPRAPQWADEAR